MTLLQSTSFNLANAQFGIFLFQDPVLFSGSIRFNLDPFDQHSDDSIWSALEISHLKGFIDTLNGGLQEPVAESGSNFR